MPQTRKEFWENKIKNNIIRDQENIKMLRNMGWRISIVWECAVKKEENFIKTLESLNKWIKEGDFYVEFPESFGIALF
jgi:DNA mismatch endonuclease (patch repair protein)